MDKEKKLKPAWEHKDESVALLRSLIDMGLGWTDARSLAETKYAYDSADTIGTDEFRKHWMIAQQDMSGLSDIKPTDLAGNEIRHGNHDNDVMTREEGLRILTDFARGRGYIARIPGSDIEIPVIPTIRERTKAVELIFKAQGFDSPTKHQIEVALREKAGASEIIVPFSDVEVVQDQIQGG